MNIKGKKKNIVIFICAIVLVLIAGGGFLYNLKSQKNASEYTNSQDDRVKKTHVDKNGNTVTEYYSKDGVLEEKDYTDDSGKQITENYYPDGTTLQDVIIRMMKGKM